MLKGSGEIKPRRDEDGNYGYSEVENPQLLVELESNGILEKFLVETVPTCPDCRSQSFDVEYVCPFSRHRNLEFGTMIEHYVCGCVDFESKFRLGDYLTCPKCRRTLKLIGQEYRRTDQLYHCPVCGKNFTAPSITFTCHKCGKDMRQEDAKLESIYGYKIREALRDELTTSVNFETQIIELLKKSSYEVTAPGIKFGSSGEEHAFDISLMKLGSETVVDIVSGTREVGPEAIVTFVAKVFDTKPAHSILVVLPGLNVEAKALSKMYGVKIIAGTDSGEVLTKLANLLGTGPSLEEPKLTVPAQRSEQVTLATQGVSELGDADRILQNARSRMASLIKKT